MARFSGVVESATALAAGVNSNSATVGGLFLNWYATSATTAKLRRVTIGVRAGASAPTSQQMSVAIIRSSAIGAGATAQTPNKTDPNSAASNCAYSGGTWSTTPTLPGVAVSNYMFDCTFNTQSGADLPWELLEELIIQGSSNGLAFFNIGNALPASHLYTCSIEWEE